MGCQFKMPPSVTCTFQVHPLSSQSVCKDSTLRLELLTSHCIASQICSQIFSLVPQFSSSSLKPFSTSLFVPLSPLSPPPVSPLDSTFDSPCSKLRYGRFQVCYSFSEISSIVIQARVLRCFGVFCVDYGVCCFYFTLFLSSS